MHKGDHTILPVCANYPSDGQYCDDVVVRLPPLWFLNCRSSDYQEGVFNIYSTRPLAGIATPSRVYLIDTGNEGRARDSRTP
jgi:hypothetical protein